MLGVSLGDSLMRAFFCLIEVFSPKLVGVDHFVDHSCFVFPEEVTVQFVVVVICCVVLGATSFGLFLNEVQHIELII